MKRDILGTPKPYYVLFFVFCGILLTTIFPRPDQSTSRASTWSIVALDPKTGDVGAAGASCVPVNAVVLAALVPKKGVAAVQAEFVLENRDLVYELLQQGLPAEEIRDRVTDTSVDSNLSLRQYGIVTLDEGVVRTAGFTGQGNFSWAGDVQDSDMAVSAQGNTLEKEEVISLALDAFHAEGLGPLPLADRLIRALEAGSAAGGDKRCNLDGVEQTAMSAFVIVVKAGHNPFTAPLSTSTELEGSNIPWLYVSVIEEPGGANPLIEIRRQYDQWRATNLPPCPLCEQFPIAIPPGGSSLAEATEFPDLEPLQTVEPTIEKAEARPSSPPQEPEPSYQDVSEEPNGTSSGVVIFLFLLTLGVMAAAIVFVLTHRSRKNRSRKS